MAICFSCRKSNNQYDSRYNNQSNNNIYDYDYDVSHVPRSSLKSSLKNTLSLKKFKSSNKSPSHLHSSVSKQGIHCNLDNVMDDNPFNFNSINDNPIPLRVSLDLGNDFMSEVDQALNFNCNKTICGNNLLTPKKGYHKRSLSNSLTLSPTKSKKLNLSLSDYGKRNYSYNSLGNNSNNNTPPMNDITNNDKTVYNRMFNFIDNNNNHDNSNSNNNNNGNNNDSNNISNDIQNNKEINKDLPHFSKFDNNNSNDNDNSTGSTTGNNNYNINDKENFKRKEKQKQKDVVMDNDNDNDRDIANDLFSPSNINNQLHSNFNDDKLPSPIFKIIDKPHSPKRSYSPLPVSTENNNEYVKKQEQNYAEKNQNSQNQNNNDNGIEIEQLHITTIWNIIEQNLENFKKSRTILSLPNRALFIRETFSSFSNIDDCKLHDKTKVKGRRNILFNWVYALIDDLNCQQIAPERSACLESLACILESKFLSSKLISSYGNEDEDRMCKVLADVINYSITKLNSRGVFQNTIFYCGRYFAIAFFRLPGIAQQLLQPLEISTRMLAKIINESHWSKDDYELLPYEVFPKHLQNLCLVPSSTPTNKSNNNKVEIKFANESRNYIKSLNESKINNDYIYLEPDNWLRRWTSDDSELFFSFIRAYHRLLERYIIEGLNENSNKFIIFKPSYIFSSPGYAQLSCILHSKIMSLVRGDIYSVTTGTPSTNVGKNGNGNDVSETANVLAATTGKPKLLDQANRRIVMTLQDMLTNSNSTEILNQKFTWLNIINLQLNLTIKCTNMYSAPQVFCLLDALDGILFTLFNLQSKFEPIDVKFLIHFLGIILENCDHVLTLIRTM